MKMNDEEATKLRTWVEAYHKASQQDADELKGAIENASQTSASAVAKYYLVPHEWMKKFLDHQPPGPIENKHFVEPMQARDGDSEDFSSDASPSSSEEYVVVSSDGEIDRDARKQKWKKIEKDRENMTLRECLSHECDYSIVGSTTWMLLTQKFDYDVEIQRDAIALDEDGEKPAEYGVVIYPNGGGLTGGSAIDTGEDSDFSFVHFTKDYKFDYGNSYAYSAAEEDNLSTEIILLENSTTTPMFDDSNNTSSSYMIVESKGSTVIQENTSTSSTYNAVPLSPTHADSQKTGTLTQQQASKKRKRVGSGLGNLGNTCFMNSTLQCLAHTNPLRGYFLSGNYASDLNRDNPLGTGGELATEFANLLKEMWGMKPKTNSYNSYNLYQSNDSVVYPRNFKVILGKHAEQFVGYNQHDSQELATYLLDALHEDTNRITKKPYSEKPEQGEDESDSEAANNAWLLHLQRENSLVVENFMGQVKSRVECPVATCGRVSTTFDPFMYLSAPLPRTTERKLKVSFVHLELGPTLKISLTLSKTAGIKNLMTEVAKIVDEYTNTKFSQSGRKIPPVIDCESLIVVELWHGKVHKFFTEKAEVSEINDSDDICIYQVASVESMRVEHKKYEKLGKKIDEMEHEVVRPPGRRLRVETRHLKNLNVSWEDELAKYAPHPHTVAMLTNQKRKSDDERFEYHKNLVSFIGLCYTSFECREALGDSLPIELLKRDEDSGICQNMPISSLENELQSEIEMEVSGEDDSNREIKVSTISHEKRENFKDIPKLESICKSSTHFQNVRSAQDVAILEFCSKKFYRYTKNLVSEKRIQNRDGEEIQLIFKRTGKMRNIDVNAGLAPIVLRLSPHTSVFDLRRILSNRFSDAMTDTSVVSNEEVTKEEKGGEKTATSSFCDNIDDESKHFLPFRKAPLSFERKSTYSYSSSYGFNKLGSIHKIHAADSATLAMSNDKEEQRKVLDVIGSKGTVIVHLTPDGLNEDLFNKGLLTSFEDLSSLGGEEEDSTQDITVKNCITKYCQREQLEESEMWYCNKCKAHVRAWKQFHLYRAPPILIIHLKRFHYSSTTHRRDKIDALVDFPLRNLDLKSEVLHWNNGEEPIYDLYGVSNHYGGLGGGHYTAYAMNDDGDWHHFDDSRVTNILESEVISSAAYVLYYRRKDVEIDDDAWTNRAMPTPISRDPSPSPTLNPLNHDMELEDELTENELDTSSGSSSMQGLGNSVDGVPMSTEERSDNDDDMESSFEAVSPPICAGDSDQEVSPYPTNE